MKAPTSSPNKPQEPPRNAATEAHNLPTFYPLFSNVSLLLPYYGIAKHRENTTPLQRNLNFCPFSAYFAHLLPLGTSHHRPPQQDQPTRADRGSPALIKPHTAGAKKGNEKGREAEREAHKPTKKEHPPLLAGHRQPLPLITNSRQKISKKSLGVL